MEIKNSSSKDPLRDDAFTVGDICNMCVWQRTNVKNI